MVTNRWNIKTTNSQLAAELAEELDVPRAVATVFIGRGLDTKAKIDTFCKLGMQHVHEPWTLPDLKPAIQRLIKALDSGERIYVHGDYDVDGVTSTAVVAHTLKTLGANFNYNVPHRLDDGYDIKRHIIDRAIEDGATLLMTVDCGIRAMDPVKYAKEKGIDVIITDHHHPSDDDEVPDCVAVINPNRLDSTYPFNGLAGVGIAFKVMLALAALRGADVLKLRDELLEFVALGTVADVAPMIDENRSLVFMGCQQMMTSKWPGVVELLSNAGVKTVSTTSIGYFLGPRINAIGRVADARSALDLLLTTQSDRAKYFVNILETANHRRKDQQAQAEAEAIALIEENKWDQDDILVVAAKGWHSGIVGLVAGKMAERYGRPALVMTINDDGTARGSARSTRHFHILDALNDKNIKPIFHKYGGHAFAAGFDLNAASIPQLRTNLNLYAKDKDGIEHEKVIDIDAILPAGDITARTLEGIEPMLPFGSGNPEPCFLSRRLNVLESKVLGADGKHLRLQLQGSSQYDPKVKAMYWRRGDMQEKFSVNTKVDVVFKLSLEEWQGRTTLQMTVEDMKLSETA